MSTTAVYSKSPKAIWEICNQELKELNSFDEKLSNSSLNEKVNTVSLRHFEEFEARKPSITKRIEYYIYFQNRSLFRDQILNQDSNGRDALYGTKDVPQTSNQVLREAMSRARIEIVLNALTLAFQNNDSIKAKEFLDIFKTLDPDKYNAMKGDLYQACKQDLRSKNLSHPDFGSKAFINEEACSAPQELKIQVVKGLMTTYSNEWLSKRLKPEFLDIEKFKETLAQEETALQNAPLQAISKDVIQDNVVFKPFSAQLKFLNDAFEAIKKKDVANATKILKDLSQCPEKPNFEDRVQYYVYFQHRELNGDLTLGWGYGGNALYGTNNVSQASNQVIAEAIHRARIEIVLNALTLAFQNNDSIKAKEFLDIFKTLDADKYNAMKGDLYQACKQDIRSKNLSHPDFGGKAFINEEGCSAPQEVKIQVVKGLMTTYSKQWIAKRLQPEFLNLYKIDETPAPQILNTIQRTGFSQEGNTCFIATALHLCFEYLNGELPKNISQKVDETKEHFELRQRIAEKILALLENSRLGMRSASGAMRDLQIQLSTYDSSLRGEGQGGNSALAYRAIMDILGIEGFRTKIPNNNSRRAGNSQLHIMLYNDWKDKFTVQQDGSCLAKYEIMNSKNQETPKTVFVTVTDGARNFPLFDKMTFSKISDELTGNLNYELVACSISTAVHTYPYIKENNHWTKYDDGQVSIVDFDAMAHDAKNQKYHLVYRRIEKNQ